MFSIQIPTVFFFCSGKNGSPGNQDTRSESFNCHSDDVTIFQERFKLQKTSYKCHHVASGKDYFLVKALTDSVVIQTTDTVIESSCYETILSGWVIYTRRHCNAAVLSVYLIHTLLTSRQLFVDTKRENIHQYLHWVN